jgi:hypothetical protein
MILASQFTVDLCKLLVRAAQNLIFERFEAAWWQNRPMQTSGPQMPARIAPPWVNWQMQSFGGATLTSALGKGSPRLRMSNTRSLRRYRMAFRLGCLLRSLGASGGRSGNIGSLRSFPALEGVRTTLKPVLWSETELFGLQRFALGWEP